MSDLYKTDYRQWLHSQQELLKARRFKDLDIDNLLDAMEYHMGDIVHTLESCLVNLLLHLLKYQYQTCVINPQRYEPQEFRSWFDSIDNARSDIRRLMRKNPSLKSHIAGAIADSYPDAKRSAITQMNKYLPKKQHLDKHSFPHTCPWSFEQVMAEDWLPESATGAATGHP